jgi:type IV pilus assembly protein PilA
MGSENATPGRHSDYIGELNLEETEMKKRSQGFSLIELLIVVTIILIIAAIAIPKLLTVKQQANATAAVANTRSLNNALTAYASQYPAIGYPGNLASLGPSTTPSSSAANLVDESLAFSGSTPKQGYMFVYAVTGAAPVAVYTINANPMNSNIATRYFYSDQTGGIRYNDGTSATSGSPLIG